MKKQVLGLVLAAMMVTTSVHAFKTDAVTNFGGNNTPTGRFYFPISTDMSVVTGFKTVMSTETNPSTVDAVLGLKYSLPILGAIDTVGVFTFKQFTNAQKDAGQASVMQWVIISKTWMAKLTDKVSIGLYVPLVKFNTANTKEVKVLDEIVPQIGMTIDLLDN